MLLAKADIGMGRNAHSVETLVECASKEQSSILTGLSVEYAIGFNNSTARPSLAPAASVTHLPTHKSVRLRRQMAPAACASPRAPADSISKTTRKRVENPISSRTREAFTIHLFVFFIQKPGGIAALAAYEQRRRLRADGGDKTELLANAARAPPQLRRVAAGGEAAT
ncbi:hypothetical protein EVAR_31549_1 [Eumeta japonica]|uniref:Uncharacterized protein n=1 Tax=Eumeta variegata TaxID=151549 RepID=A0A4C1V801_EUMVA|nr:hypothetical protein EVAR_31549_1 [Eumeta japonica]